MQQSEEIFMKNVNHIRKVLRLGFHLWRVKKYLNEFQ